MIAPRVAPQAPTGRTLPHDVETEARLLSSVMFDGAPVLTKCIMAGIKPESFYEANHQTLYENCLDLYSRNEPVTIDCLAAELKTKKLLEGIGGYPFLAQVSEKCPSTLEAAKFIRVVREQALLRELIRSRTTTVEEAYGFAGGFDEFLSGVMERESRVTASGIENEEESVQKEAAALLAELDLPKSQRQGFANEVSWGLPDVDRICGKMAPGSLVILAGRPSTGKSALADMAAWNAARAGYTVVVFSYEMTKREKIIRIAQQVSGVNMAQFDDAPMDKKLDFTEAIRQVKGCPHFHIFERDTTIQRIRARCRALAQKTKIGLIVCDFIQYLSRMEPTIAKERTDEKIGRLTAGFKAMAKEHDCPALVLSSLNRGSESESKDSRPTIANLRNSGEIESDADVVMILHWPKTNPKTGTDQDPHDQQQNSFYAEANQEKGRNRGVHQVPLCFTRTATKFSCWSHH